MKFKNRFPKQGARVRFLERLEGAMLLKVSNALFVGVRHFELEPTETELRFQRLTFSTQAEAHAELKEVWRRKVQTELNQLVEAVLADPRT